MLTLAEVQPKFSIVERAVSDVVSNHVVNIIRELIEQGKYREAVMTLADTARTGGYAANVVWSVAAAMYASNSLSNGFHNFGMHIRVVIVDLRIVKRGEWNKENNALTYLSGEITDPRAAVVGTLHQVIHKPLLAAERAAFAVSFSRNGDKDTQIERLEQLINNIG